MCTLGEAIRPRALAPYLTYLLQTNRYAYGRDFSKH